MNGKITSILKGVLQRFRLLKSRNIFLEDDYNVPRELKNPNYLYPAKLPAFIAKIGLFEIEKWEQTKHTRIRIFKKYKSLFEEFGFSEYLPKAYNDTGIQIVPLRFVLSHPDANNIKNLFKLYLDIESTWFMAPIIVCSEPSELGYRYGSCNQAELFGERALNFPCALNNIDANRLIKLLTETLTNQKNVNKI
jgi:dTDP-4-amino-4,6-dideoxygalactose transaminase